MSEYRHDLHKFSDAGLQLRLPVDLVPSGQYNRLSNAIPIIEGELRTREGLTLVGVPTEVTFLDSLEIVNPGDATAPIANTVYPHGLVNGQTATIDILGINAADVYTFDTTNTAGSGANDGGAGTAWTNPGNVTDPTSYADVALVALSSSQNVLCEAFGFAAPTIAAFTSIIVTFEVYSSVSTASVRADVQLLKAGVPTGPVQSAVGFQVGGVTNPQTVTLTFDGSGFSDTDVNDAAFGVQIMATAIETAAAVSCYIRNVQIRALLLSTAYPATYSVTVTSITSPTQFHFTPAIAVGIAVGVTLPVFGMITSSQQYNNLPNTIITNIFRLNQAITSVNGDRIVAIGGRIWRAPLPAGNAFEELIAPLTPSGTVPTAPNTLSGGTLSIIEFRFTLDSQSWMLVGDAQQMYKYRSGPTLQQVEFVPLGNAPPTVPATATAGATGNLTGDYDWRYTYVDGLALTESNPSPINQTTGSQTVNPSSYVNSGFSGVTNSAGTGTENITGGNGTPASGSASCTWENFAVPPTGTIESNVLNVTIVANASVASAVNSGGSVFMSAQYSYDAGVTYISLLSTGTGGGNGIPGPTISINQTYQVTLPSSVSPANIIVQASINATASGAPGVYATVTSSITLSAISLTLQIESSINTLTLATQAASVCVTPSPYAQHTFINLYRRGGSLPDTWRLSGQFQVSTLVQGSCGAGTLLITDDVSDTTLSTSPIIELDNDQPVTSVTKLNQALSFIWGPVGVEARVLGCGDPARPECVYFSKPGNADAWPPENFIEVSSPGTPIIAGCVYNTRTFAFSREGIYELVEGLGTGATYTPFRTPSARGLFSPWGLAIGPSMYFIAKDGIYESTGGQETSIVENDIKPLFPTYDTPGESIEGYEAIDFSQPDFMRLRYHNNELYFIYIGATSGEFQMLVFDVYKRRWRAVLSTSGVSEIYSEPATASSLLEGTAAGSVYQANGSFDPVETNLLLGVGVTTVTVASSAFGTATYAARVTALSADGEVSMSYDFDGLSLDATTGIAVTFPNAALGIIAWRVYYGLSGDLETQYIDYAEAQVAAFTNRQAVIITLGTAGNPPTVNASDGINVNIRTGANDQGAPLNKKQYGNVIFDLDPDGASVAITPYINGEAQAESILTVTGTGRQQVPLDLSDYFAFNTEYEIVWRRTLLSSGAVSDPVLYQYDTLHFFEPVEVVHWEAQPTSASFPGFMHYRDAYIAIRSTNTVTLSMTFDNGTGTETTQVYNVASTGGLRQKVYIQFASNKGLLYKFALDSQSASFRVYVEDIEFRTKPWLGLLGYEVTKPVGAEATT